jgi:acyl-coenzyme A thioesterase PaaI-like protein
VTGHPNIVDGHGADDAFPPGPELARVVDALRRATDLVVRPGAPPGVLADAADHVERAVDLLDGPTRPWRASLPARPQVGLGPDQFFPFSPMIGRYSPLAPPVRCEVHDDGAVVGHAVLGAAYEGPPGCVHGGIIAGLFDEVLGVANIAAGVGAMTGTLTVVYRSPTPLYAELRLEARTETIERRKVRTTGTLRAGARLCAEAAGTFVLVPHERFATHTREHGAPTAP